MNYRVRNLFNQHQCKGRVDHTGPSLCIRAGKKGTVKRDKLEADYENFKIGALLYEARHEKGLTQEELAEKVGTTKSYISKIENNIKEARDSI